MDRPYARDENLPEVVPDSSPEALSQAELYKQHGFDGGEGKFPAGPGWDGEKYTPSPLSPQSGVVAQLPGRPEEGYDAARAEPAEERRICGVKRKIFWILVGVAILAIIAISVGAGVGATRNSGGGSSDSQEQGEGGSASSSSVSSVSAAATPSSSSVASISSTPSTSSEVSSSATSSSAEATPTFLNNQTAPNSFAFQAFSDYSYGGNASEVFREEGFIDIGFDAVSYVWLNNGSTCCITFCQGEEDVVGWRCDDRRQNSSTSELNRVNIWCNLDPEREKTRCS